MKKQAAFDADHQLKTNIKPSATETGHIDPETGKPYSLEQDIIERIPYDTKKYEDKPLLDEDNILDILNEYPEDIQGTPLGVGDTVNLIGEFIGSSQQKVESPVLDQDGNPVLDAYGQPITETTYRLYTEEESKRVQDYIETGKILGFIVDKDPEDMFLKGEMENELKKEYIKSVRPDVNTAILKTRRDLIDIIDTQLTPEQQAELREFVLDEIKSLDFSTDIPWVVVSIIDPETGEKVIDKKTNQPKVLTLVQYNISKIAKDETLGGYLIRISSAAESIIKRCQTKNLNEYIKLAKINQEEYMLYNKSYNQLELPEEYNEEKKIDEQEIPETSKDALEDRKLCNDKKAELFSAIERLACCGVCSPEEDKAIIDIISISSELPKEEEYGKLADEINQISEEFAKTGKEKNTFKLSNFNSIDELLKYADDNTSHPFMPNEISEDDQPPVTPTLQEQENPNDVSMIDGKRTSAFTGEEIPYIHGAIRQIVQQLAKTDPDSLEYKDLIAEYNGLVRALYQEGQTTNNIFKFLAATSFKSVDDLLKFAAEFGNMAEKEELGPTETSNEEVQKPGLDTKD